ncbi:hypothetical protein BDV10DRAFT_179987 [Aspergillus recurvatus]
MQGISADGSGLVVMEGFLRYLPENDVPSLLQRFRQALSKGEFMISQVNYLLSLDRRELLLSVSSMGASSTGPLTIKRLLRLFILV